MHIIFQKAKMLNRPRNDELKIVGATLAVALIFSMAIGCSRLFYRSSEVNRGDRPVASTKNENDILIEPIDEQKLSRILSQFQGKIVLVNFWATWCLPCMEEFPSLVMLDNKYNSKGLEVIAISFDDKSQLKDQVLPFVKSQKAQFKVYLKDVEDNEKFINSIDKNWIGAIPATLVFDRSGTLVKSVIGEQTLEDFESMIRPLL